ncbi:hypothetical protein [Glaciimonas sp. PAMC28666]|uniref:hypothetical protein n=1 Tax=Glaciimonas sp. PAMC28666 TaxID=2807626 RepID=UPI001F04C117|nr:hypothetical protein [Glaciimonas sp. PAMC28666]
MNVINVISVISVKSAIKATNRFSVKFSTVASVVVITGLLAACGSSVPLNDTRSPAAELPGLGKVVASPSLTTGQFSCELGNRVEIALDGSSGASMTWKGSKYAMVPVSTTTGAVRFENRASGMVWIQIPAKSMLLNTKQGAQLANECRVR